MIRKGVVVGGKVTVVGGGRVVVLNRRELGMDSETWSWREVGMEGGLVDGRSLDDWKGVLVSSNRERHDHQEQPW